MYLSSWHDSAPLRFGKYRHLIYELPSRSDNRKLKLCDIHLRLTDSGQSSPIRAYLMSGVTLLILPIPRSCMAFSNTDSAVDPPRFLRYLFRSVYSSMDEMTWGMFIRHAACRIHEAMNSLLDQYCAMAVRSWKSVEPCVYSIVPIFTVGNGYYLYFNISPLLLLLVYGVCSHLPEVAFKFRFRG